MKTYKEFEKRYIGQSDLAELKLVGGNREGINQTEVMCFGEDGCYSAYVVDEANVSIGSHYKKVAEFYHSIQIIDDQEVTFEKFADKIEIYRAGEYGCIIYLINEE